MKEFICIACPRGCHLKVDDALNVTGNLCPKGEIYGKSEATNPVRTITSTGRVVNREDILITLKTSVPIPKGMMREVMKEINKLRVNAPIKIGDILLKNVLGLNADIVATKNIE